MSTPSTSTTTTAASRQASQQAFLTFANGVPFYGLAVLCLDHPTVQGMIPEIEKRHVTYGLSSQAHYRATDVELSGFHSLFSVSRGGESLGRFELPMVGEHNVLNSLAAIAVADELSIPVDTTREALRLFRVDRPSPRRGRGRHGGRRLWTSPGRDSRHPGRRTSRIWSPSRGGLSTASLHPHA